MNRKCLHCGEPVSGRSDKKFCSDYCRSSYNYDSKSETYGYVRKVNYILRKNWKLLNEFNPNGKAKIRKSKMLEKGYNFNYFTNTYTNQKGVTYYYVYNMGYISADEGYVTLLKKPDYIE